ncbi:MAG: hypothetical protein IKT40_07855 [Bacilli bacterium]|nr:hypothetical protein [Bacilli bacterium]
MAANNRRNFDIYHYYCTNCGHEVIPISRKKSKTRKDGHLKKMYCPHCKEYQNTYQCSSPEEHDKFIEKFKNGEFKELVEQTRLLLEEKKVLIEFLNS